MLLDTDGESTKQFSEKLRKLPPAYDAITHTFDLNNKRFSKEFYSAPGSPCFPELSAFLKCYVDSGTQIKGMDCEGNALDLLRCCKRTRKCHPRLVQAADEEPVLGAE